jgi:hypothetical protein
MSSRQFLFRVLGKRDHHPPLQKQLVSSFPYRLFDHQNFESPQGQIQIVDALPDFTIQWVDALPGVRRGGLNNGGTNLSQEHKKE